jgi:hypothetical protein
VIRHTSIGNGDVFSSGGGPGGVILSSASVASEGYVLGDAARLGGGGSTGSDARLFTMHFESVGPGVTDVYFGQILLRDSANQPVAHDAVPAVVSVAGPLPAASETRMYAAEARDADYVLMGSTDAHLRVKSAGDGVRGKVTVARHDAAPSAGSGAPFTDPDETLVHLGFAARHWVIASSLAGQFDVDLAFSYEGLDGPADPQQYRVATRQLGAHPNDSWTILPLSQTIVDVASRTVRIEGPTGTYGSGQYALAFDAPISTAEWATAGDLSLQSAYPNPFSDKTTIIYDLPAAAGVRISVHDLLGREVALLQDDPKAAGRHYVTWSRSGLAAGVYAVRLQAGGLVATQRIVVVR